MTEDELHANLVRWIAARTGVTTIKAYQSGHRPDLPYVMVNLPTIGEVRENEQETEYAEDVPSGRIMAKPVIETEWMFSIHAYGPSPTGILRPLRAAAKLAQVNEPLLPLVVIHDISIIRNVPEWVNNAWEPRAQMDLSLRGLVRDGHLIDTIEQYELTIGKL